LKITADYHIHTELCGHAVGQPEAYADQAFQKGLQRIGFTDHLPACGRYQPVHAMAMDQLDLYVQQVEAARKAFPELEILCGVEADIYPGFEAHLERMRQHYKFDYVIGSVHYVMGQFLFDPIPRQWGREEAHIFIRRYCALLEMGIESGLIDVVGHIDGIKWLFSKWQSDIEMQIQGVLQRIGQKGLVLELNTSGRRKKPGSPYPDLPILKMASVLNIPLVVGSDAHKPEQIAVHFDLAAEMLQTAGYLKSSIQRSGLNAFLPT